MAHLYDDETDTLCLIYFDIIVPSVSVILIAIMLPAFCKYIKSKKKSKNNCLYKTGLIFFISIFLSIIANTTYTLFICRSFKMYTILINILNQCYAIQTLLLDGILFARLYYVFEETLFSLSKTTIRLYWIFYSIMCLVFISAAIAVGNYRETIPGIILAGSAFLMLISAVIILISLFLYKMTQVYKFIHTNKGKANPALLKIITKTSTLAIISVLATLLDSIGIMIVPFARTIHCEFMANLLFTFDLFTNFWCIILSYHWYHEWYIKMCGGLDRKCTKCWHKIVSSDGDDIPVVVSKVRIADESQIQTQTNGSSQVSVELCSIKE